MNKTNQLAADHFVIDKPFKLGTTEVSVSDGQTCLSVQGQCLVVKKDAGIHISHGGFPAFTIASDRVNAVLDAYGLGHVAGDDGAYRTNLRHNWSPDDKTPNWWYLSDRKNATYKPLSEFADGFIQVK